MRGGRDGAALVTAGTVRALARIPPPAGMHQGRPSLCCVASIRGSQGAPEPGEGARGWGRCGIRKGWGGSFGLGERDALPEWG